MATINFTLNVGKSYYHKGVNNSFEVLRTENGVVMGSTASKEAMYIPITAKNVLVTLITDGPRSYIKVKSISEKDYLYWKLGLNPKNELPLDQALSEPRYMEDGTRTLYERGRVVKRDGNVIMEFFRTPGSLVYKYFKLYVPVSELKDFDIW